MFALANGHIGLRANLDEGEPFGLPGTYLDGFYELRPLPYAEAGYGYPESGQTVVNVTNGKIIRLLVEDEPFDVRYGELRHHERVLDLRAGVLRRSAEWVSPTGRAVRVSSTRLVSFTQRAMAAIEYEVEPLDGAHPGGAPVGARGQRGAARHGDGDPRAAAALAAPLNARVRTSHGHPRACSSTRPRRARCASAAAMDHVIDGPAETDVAIENFDDLARLTVTADLEPGTPLRIVKFIAYGWSAQRSVPAIARPGGGGPGRGQARRLGRAGQGAARPISTTTGSAPTSRSTATPSFSRRSDSRCSTPSRPGPEASSGDPGQGSDRPGLRRTHLLGHRGVRAADAHLRRPSRGAAMRCGGGTPRSVSPVPARSRSACAAPPSPGGRSTARSARATGPPARPHFTSTPTSPTPSPATTTSTQDDEFDRRRRGRAAGARRRGCGARSVTTIPPVGSASTA